MTTVLKQTSLISWRDYLTEMEYSIRQFKYLNKYIIEVAEVSDAYNVYVSQDSYNTKLFLFALDKGCLRTVNATTMDAILDLVADNLVRNPYFIERFEEGKKL